MEKGATHKTTWERKSCDQPLLVLRYLKRRMIVPMMAVFILLPMEYYGLFVHVSRSTFELIMVKAGAIIFLLIVLPALADMLLFKEIRLYRDRIVKVWKLLGSREMHLAKVGLAYETDRLFGVGKKRFFAQGRNSVREWLLGTFHIAGISYKEHFADRGQVKQLNALLAELSGRKVEEFEQTGTMERLIKEEKQ